MLDTELAAAIDRISLCMIVRNEAESLERCLLSVKPWVGEMVVVDTGSTDETVAIAERCGARVEHFAWCDDFAAARNFALDAASREWALVVDADEQLVVEQPEYWKRAVTQTELDALCLGHRNQNDEGQVASAVVLRLFRRTRADMRYRGELHEQLIGIADNGAPNGILPGIFLDHTGYTTRDVVGKGKQERNLKLARKLVESRPQDFHSWYVLAISTRGLSYQEAVDAYARALELWDASGRDGKTEIVLADLFIGYVEVLRATGQDARAREILDRALDTFPHSPDLHHHRGQLRMMAQDFAGAAADFEACLTPEARGFFMILDPTYAGVKSRTLLALAWLNLGRNVEAEELLKQAVAEAPPTYVSAHRLLGTQLLQRGEWGAALPLLERAFAGEPEETRFNLAWCRYKLERYDEAAEVMGSLAETPDGQHLLGKIHLEAGRGEEALALLEACPLPSAGLARGWATFLTGHADKAAASWEEWLRAGAADWGTKDTLSMFMFLMQGGRPPKGQPERPAEPLRDMDQWFRLLLRYKRFDEVEGAIGRGPQLGERLWVPLRKRWGATLSREGFHDVAVMLLLQAQQAEPEDPDIYYWLGHSSLYKQQVDVARDMWEACLQLQADHPLASQGLGLLKSEIK